MLSIPDIWFFVFNADDMAQRWRRRHGLPVPGRPTLENARKTLRVLEKELDAGLPDIHPEEIVTDAAAAMSQLIIARLGGMWDWTPTHEPALVTDRDERVFFLRPVVAYAIQRKPRLFWWYERLVKGTLPDPFRPERVQ
jgi:hypothetical protein